MDLRRCSAKRSRLAMESRTRARQTPRLSRTIFRAPAGKSLYHSSTAEERGPDRGLLLVPVTSSRREAIRHGGQIAAYAEIRRYVLKCLKEVQIPICGKRKKSSRPLRSLCDSH